MVTPKNQTNRDYLFIEEWMNVLGLTDEALGELMSKSRTTIWRWRTDQKRLNPKKIAAIAKAMKMAPEDFWRKPGRPSIDALLKGASDDMVIEAAEVVKVLLRRAA